MNLFKKTYLVLTPLVFSALLTTSAVAETSGAAPATKETPEETALRLTTEYTDLIGSWFVVLKKGRIESPAKFSFLADGVLLHSGNPMAIVPHHLLFNDGWGAWEQNSDGSFSIHYYRSIYRAADGTYYDDEETTGTLSFDENQQLVGNLTVGMVKANSKSTALNSTQVTFKGEKINAVKNKASTD